MTPAPQAFLSYTRKDDEFFGGYITAFRKVLENAVQVVTGEQTFRIFQDIEGIVIGENWQKSLAEAIQRATFLVPMLTPLFFNSEACRDEVRQFLEHERALERDDLILPIYFLSSAKVEKEEQRDKDPLVKELFKRQMVDWRQNADLSLQEAAARKPVLELARKVAAAIERLEMPEAAAAKPRRDLRDPARAVASSLGDAFNLKREKIASRTILWVDDQPGNNQWERRALESYGVRFELARDSRQAQQLLAERGPFAAIISDLGRPGDRRAGLTLLEELGKAGLPAPYFIFTSRTGTRYAAQAEALGARGTTADPDALVQMVLAAIGGPVA